MRERWESEREVRGRIGVCFCFFCNKLHKYVKTTALLRVRYGIDHLLQVPYGMSLICPIISLAYFLVCVFVYRRLYILWFYILQCSVSVPQFVSSLTDLSFIFHWHLERIGLIWM